MLTILKQGERPAAPFRISNYQISIETKNQLSQTEIEQIFVNPNDFKRDDIYYIFPLADDAMIPNFAFSINGKGMRGEILTAMDARQVYMEIERDAGNPLLLKYIGTRAYIVRVGQIPAKGEIRIRFVYWQMLSIGSVFAKYKHPLSLAQATRACIENFRVNINVKSDLDIQRISLPSRGIVVDNQRWVAYEERNLNPDKDFAFEYTVSDPRFGIGLIAHRTHADSDGFFKLFISPRYENQIPNIAPKNFIFLFDRSESMAGEKIRRAKEVLRHCIYNLTFRDGFNILACNGNIASLNTSNGWEEQFAPVVFDNFFHVRHERRRALTFIENIEAAGRTNINDALLTALNGNRQPIIVLLTDGTCAMNAPRILENIAEVNTDQARIFVIGVGDGLNAHLLDRLAVDNGGTYRHLEPNEDIEVAVSSLFKEINDPIFTNIKIDFGDIAIEDVYPQEVPDMFSHKQLTLVGRYKGQADTNLKLRGFINGEEHEFTKDVRFPEFQSRFDFLPHLWAQVKVKALENEVEQRESNSELIEEIKRLSRAYGVLTPCTE
jgi:Ca-activated chloride channel family protein